ncbi:SPW repeat protein [Pseudonocardia sichuanensis]|uniref:SPW repeat-containing protein n=1 Tax=Pseudonocardia kunmingensis TaxID=630975 RepID=A0A543DJX4_9PSEU|nr:SPW repeat protein [Pseudonocardia kunmingensis]TQM09535.1 SPW repeat-containing protein [Pseudonocardia kunmingensis]
MTRAWQRWQDWAALVIGVLTALSPIVVSTDSAAMWSLIVFGVLIAAAALWSLAQPGSVASEYVHAVLGALLFISPWVFGYADLAGASWTSWVAGVLTVAVGLAALPSANAEHRGLAGSH